MPLRTIRGGSGRWYPEAAYSAFFDLRTHLSPVHNQVSDLNQRFPPPLPRLIDLSNFLVYCSLADYPCLRNSSFGPIVAMLHLALIASGYEPGPPGLRDHAASGDRDGIPARVDSTPGLHCFKPSFSPKSHSEMKSRHRRNARRSHPVLSHKSALYRLSPHLFDVIDVLNGHVPTPHHETSSSRHHPRLSVHCCGFSWSGLPPYRQAIRSLDCSHLFRPDTCHRWRSVPAHGSQLGSLADHCLACLSCCRQRVPLV